ncbi:hypothetical protein F511_41902 [Dorcoceras hygrometricum]|uniref:Uncharacterized protein n=1 Tax=Dorcoceras hygrometricum TaxID=472368 RepID=A0A2Z7C8X5_9LAMI|nr:hypothetical protein F511_41902 [Dorcoceras hygrometricum]
MPEIQGDKTGRNTVRKRSDEGRTTAAVAAQRAAQGRAFLPHGSAHIALHNVRRKAARCWPSVACMVRQKWRTTALISAKPAASGRPQCAASAHGASRVHARGGAPPCAAAPRPFQPKILFSRFRDLCNYGTIMY